MAKYTTEFKLMIVIEYLNNSIGYPALAKKYKVKSFQNIREWVANYKIHGVDGLKRRGTSGTFTGKFKLNVLQYMKETGCSLLDTAIKFNISKASTITRWNKEFLEGGIDALSKPKGRPRIHMSNNHQPKAPKKVKELTREQELERENLLLRIELEYLKKLQAHGLEELKKKDKKE